RQAARIDIVEAPIAVERIGHRCEAELAPERRLHGVAGSEAGMQRFAHGAEILHVAAGHRIDDAERAPDLVGVKAKELAAGCGGAESADGAGRMPAAFERMRRLR